MDGSQKLLCSFFAALKASKTAQRMWAACRGAYRIAWNCSTYLGSLHYLTLVWIWSAAFFNEHRWITFNDVLMRYDHLIVRLIRAFGSGA